MANKKISDLENTDIINDEDIVMMDQWENGRLKSKKFRLVKLFSRLKTIFGHSLFGLGDIDSPKDNKTYGRNNGSWKEVSDGLNVGTTIINNGSPGGVLFQNTNNEIGENSNFLWDDTNQRLSIGFGINPTAQLEIKANGVLSTDYSLRVRNTSSDFLNVNGLGEVYAKLINTPEIDVSYIKNYNGTISCEFADKMFFRHYGTPLMTMWYPFGLQIHTGDIWFTDPNGGRLGASAIQKLAFWGAKPIAQPILPTSSSLVNVIAALQLMGLCRES